VSRSDKNFYERITLVKKDPKVQLAEDSKAILINLAKFGVSFAIANVASLATEQNVWGWPDLIKLGAIIATCTYGAITLVRVPQWIRSYLDRNKIPEPMGDPKDEFYEENVASIREGVAKAGIQELIFESEVTTTNPSIIAADAFALKNQVQNDQDIMNFLENEHKEQDMSR